MSDRWVRAERAWMFEQGDALFLLDARQVLRRMAQQSADLARAVLALYRAPRSRDELLLALSELTGAPIESTDVIDALCDELKRAGAIVRVPSHTPHVQPPAMGRAGLRVVLGITGAVQSSFSPTMASLLMAEGHTVRVCATEESLRFCSAMALTALTHSPVCSSLWDASAYGPAPHIRLAEWADLVLVAPASATTLSRIAQGVCDNPVSAVALATRAPVLLAPSMNVAMLEAPAIARTLETLRLDGHWLIEPTQGHEVALAPSARAPMHGTMPPPHELIPIVRAVVSTGPARRLPHAVSSLASWDARYLAEPDTRPWQSDALDEGLAELLAQHSAPSLRALDVGCGTGLVAAHLASLGCSVTALDGAAAAIAQAQARYPRAHVRWLCADARTVTLDGTFGLVHDRALLHVLAPEDVPLVLARYARWLSDQGTLVISVHSAQAPESLGTTRYTEASLRALLAPLGSVTLCESCTLRGPEATEVPALRAVLTRQG
ncbi:MAG: flavoprotein [Deltaproteobacteria bacterium]|nr:flavoprotein [Deltaproteobacteria bacterium]